MTASIPVGIIVSSTDYSKGHGLAVNGFGMNDIKLIKVIRRENLRALANELGGDTELANALERSPAQISHLIGINPTKDIGERLARDIETALRKPRNWLDQVHGVNDRLLDSVMEAVDNAIRASRLPIPQEKRRKIVAVYYNIVASGHSDQGLLRSLIDLAAP